jgi:hypothetical protein
MHRKKNIPLGQQIISNKNGGSWTERPKSIESRQPKAQAARSTALLAPPNFRVPRSRLFFSRPR